METVLHFVNNIVVNEMKIDATKKSKELFIVKLSKLAVDTEDAFICFEIDFSHQFTPMQLLKVHISPKSKPILINKSRTQYSILNMPEELPPIKIKTKRMMATGKRLVFHAIGVIHHAVTLCILNSFDFRETNNVVLMQIHEFSYKYFTIWTFAFQLIFLVCALICDIGEIKPELAEMLWPKHGILEKCGKLKDFMFHTIIFPCTGHTVIAFWSVYFYDRELVLPAVIDKYIHPILNHAVHTNIIAVVLLEIILGNTKYLKTNLKKSLLSLGVLAFVYYAIVIWTYFTSGKWIYKFFDVFTTWTERCMFFASCVICLYLMFFLGIHAQEIITEYSIIKKKAKALKETNKSETNGDTKNKKIFKSLTGDFKILRNIND